MNMFICRRILRGDVINLRTADMLVETADTNAQTFGRTGRGEDLPGEYIMYITSRDYGHMKRAIVENLANAEFRTKFGEHIQARIDRIKKTKFMGSEAEAKQVREAQLRDLESLQELFKEVTRDMSKGMDASVALKVLETRFQELRESGELGKLAKLTMELNSYENLGESIQGRLRDICEHYFINRAFAELNERIAESSKGAEGVARGTQVVREFVEVLMTEAINKIARETRENWTGKMKTDVEIIADIYTRVTREARNVREKLLARVRESNGNFGGITKEMIEGIFIDKELSINIADALGKAKDYDTVTMFDVTSGESLIQLFAKARKYMAPVKKKQTTAIETAVEMLNKSLRSTEAETRQVDVRDIVERFAEERGGLSYAEHIIYVKSVFGLLDSDLLQESVVGLEENIASFANVDDAILFANRDIAPLVQMIAATLYFNSQTGETGDLIEDLFTNFSGVIETIRVSGEESSYSFEGLDRFDRFEEQMQTILWGSLDKALILKDRIVDAKDSERSSMQSVQQVIGSWLRSEVPSMHSFGKAIAAQVIADDETFRPTELNSDGEEIAVINTVALEEFVQNAQPEEIAYFMDLVTYMDSDFRTQVVEALSKSISQEDQTTFMSNLDVAVQTMPQSYDGNIPFAVYDMYFEARLPSLSFADKANCIYELTRNMPQESIAIFAERFKGIAGSEDSKRLGEALLLQANIEIDEMRESLVGTAGLNLKIAVQEGTISSFTHASEIGDIFSIIILGNSLLDITGQEISIDEQEKLNTVYQTVFDFVEEYNFLAPQYQAGLQHDASEMIDVQEKIRIGAEVVLMQLAQANIFTRETQPELAKAYLEIIFADVDAQAAYSQGDPEKDTPEDIEQRMQTLAEINDQAYLAQYYQKISLAQDSRRLDRMQQHAISVVDTVFELFGITAPSVQKTEGSLETPEVERTGASLLELVDFLGVNYQMDLFTDGEVHDRIGIEERIEAYKGQLLDFAIMAAGQNVDWLQMDHVSAEERRIIIKYANERREEWLRIEELGKTEAGTGEKAYQWSLVMEKLLGQAGLRITGVQGRVDGDIGLEISDVVEFRAMYEDFISIALPHKERVMTPEIKQAIVDALSKAALTVNRVSVQQLFEVQSMVDKISEGSLDMPQLTQLFEESDGIVRVALEKAMAIIRDANITVPEEIKTVVMIELAKVKESISAEQLREVYDIESKIGATVLDLPQLVQLWEESEGVLKVSLEKAIATIRDGDIAVPAEMRAVVVAELEKVKENISPEQLSEVYEFENKMGLTLLDLPQLVQLWEESEGAIKVSLEKAIAIIHDGSVTVPEEMRAVVMVELEKIKENISPEQLSEVQNIETTIAETLLDLPQLVKLWEESEGAIKVSLEKAIAIIRDGDITVPEEMRTVVMAELAEVKETITSVSLNVKPTLMQSVIDAVMLIDFSTISEDGRLEIVITRALESIDFGTFDDATRIELEVMKQLVLSSARLKTAEVEIATVETMQTEWVKKFFELATEQGLQEDALSFMNEIFSYNNDLSLGRARVDEVGITDAAIERVQGIQYLQGVSERSVLELRMQRVFNILVSQFEQFDIEQGTITLTPEMKEAILEELPRLIDIYERESDRAFDAAVIAGEPLMTGELSLSETPEYRDLTPEQTLSAALDRVIISKILQPLGVESYEHFVALQQMVSVDGIRINRLNYNTNIATFNALPEIVQQRSVMSEEVMKRVSDWFAKAGINNRVAGAVTDFLNTEVGMEKFVSEVQLFDSLEQFGMNIDIVLERWVKQADQDFTAQLQDVRQKRQDDITSKTRRKMVFGLDAIIDAEYLSNPIIIDMIGKSTLIRDSLQKLFSSFSSDEGHTTIIMVHSQSDRVLVEQFLSATGIAINQFEIKLLDEVRAEVKQNEEALKAEVIDGSQDDLSKLTYDMIVRAPVDIEGVFVTQYIVEQPAVVVTGEEVSVVGFNFESVGSRVEEIELTKAEQIDDQKKRAA
ncbi:hypothetical protein ACFL3D_01560 [Candidatus Omnitrophota bacterium]